MPSWFFYISFDEELIEENENLTGKVMKDGRGRRRKISPFLHEGDTVMAVKSKEGLHDWWLVRDKE